MVKDDGRLLHPPELQFLIHKVWAMIIVAGFPMVSLKCIDPQGVLSTLSAHGKYLPRACFRSMSCNPSWQVEQTPIRHLLHHLTSRPPRPSSPLSLQLEHSRRRSRVVHATCLFPGPLSSSTASLWSLVGFSQKRTLK